MTASKKADIQFVFKRKFLTKNYKNSTNTTNT